MAIRRLMLAHYLGICYHDRSVYMSRDLKTKFFTGVAWFLTAVLLSAGSPTAVAQQPSGTLSAGLQTPSAPKVNCRVPVYQIGSFSLTDGEAVVSNGFVNIFQRSLPGSTDALLTGRIIKLDATGIASDGTRNLSGLVLFLSGSMLSQLEANNNDAALDIKSVEDLVFRSEGSVAGHITGCTDRSLTINSRGTDITVPLATIRYLRSPHAFIFTLTGRLSADQTHTRAEKISFRATSSEASLGGSLVAGKKPDPLDAMMDDQADLQPAPPLQPSQIWGTPGARPFNNWP